MAKLSLALSLCALVVALFAAFANRDDSDAGSAAEKDELAYHMAYLQRYAEKLYFAGRAGNTALAQFYIHEIGETAGLVGEQNYMEDDIALTPLVERLLLPAVSDLAGAIESEGVEDFGRAYEGLVGSCNACHEATRHGFVRIRTPLHTGYPNQDFSPHR